MRIYSFPPLAQPHSKVLILGTMPGKESLAKQQYYAHPQNVFWRILLQLCDVPFTSDYTQRCNTLFAHNISLWDVIQSCERDGSADSAIKKELPNNLEEFLRNHPQVQCIICNGKKAATLLHRHFSEYITIPVIQAPSTSPAYALCSYEEKLKKWQEIMTQYTDIVSLTTTDGSIHVHDE